MLLQAVWELAIMTRACGGHRTPTQSVQPCSKSKTSLELFPLRLPGDAQAALRVPPLGLLL